MPLDLVAARADLALRRPRGELPAGDVIQSGAEQPATNVGPEFLADRGVVQTLLAEAAHFLVQVVTVRLGAVGSEADAETRVGGLDLVQHLPRAPVLPATAGQIEVRERLGDRSQGRVVGRPGALPAGAVVHGETSAVDERALREVGDVRVAPVIEVGEETGEHPEDEVGGRMMSGFPLAALESGQPLSGRAMGALTALLTLPRCHAPTPSLSCGVDLAISALSGRACAILFAKWRAARRDRGGRSDGPDEPTGSLPVHRLAGQREAGELSPAALHRRHHGEVLLEIA